ncbi:MAG: flagellar export chaperone FliS [bacterium]
MSYVAQTAYRDMEVLSASPGRLVVIVYDFLLVHLRRAGIAIDTANAQLLTVSLHKSQDAVAELMGELDMERGGQIARELAALYAFFLRSLLDLSATKDRHLLTRVTAQVNELRDAFAEIAVSQTATAA